MTWDQRRWRVATEGDLFTAAKEVSQGILVEAQQQGDMERQRKLIAWALKSMSVNTIRAMLTMAATEKVCETSVTDFDRDPHLLTVANGTVDLRTGMLRPHDRRDFLTKLVDIEYDRDARHERLTQFLREVFDGKDELIAYIKRAVGYSLTGHTREHCFFFLYGLGANGKSVLVRIIMMLAGEMAVATSFSTLTADRTGGAATPDLADLAGARIVVSGEADDGVRLSEGLVKSLTGDDSITCRRLYEGPFTFRPQFTLWLHANHKPTIRGTDDGIWRRVRLVPFDVSFKGREDRELLSKLEAELPGILNWAIEGASEWFEHGLGDTPEVTTATQGYRVESDMVGQFVGDELMVDSGNEVFITTKRLYEIYEAWCEQAAVDPLKTATLTKRLTARGLKAGRHLRERGIFGVRAKTAEEKSDELSQSGDR